MPVTAPPATAPATRPSRRRGSLRRGVDVLARAGGLASPASLLVLGVAVAGAVDGRATAPAGRGPTVTVTIVYR